MPLGPPRDAVLARDLCEFATFLTGRGRRIKSRVLLPGEAVALEASDLRFCLATIVRSPRLDAAANRVKR